MTLTEYDSRNRVVATTAPDGAVTRTEYDLAGRVVAEIDALNHRTEHEFDAAGREVLTRNALLEETRFEHDALGRVENVIAPDGAVTSNVYDLAGRVVERILPDGSREGTTFDAAGRVVAKTDANLHTTGFGYDALGRLTSVTDALDHVTRYAYDSRGRKVSQTDALNRVTTWGFDRFGREVRRTLPLGQTERRVYDAFGRLAEKSDFAQNVTTFAYDAYDRPVQTSFADGTVETRTHDVHGQLLTVSDSSAALSYQRDTRNRVTSIANSRTGGIAYTYDPSGKELSITSTNSVVSYTRDVLGRIATVSQNGSLQASYEYRTGFGRKLTHRVLNSGVSEVREYNNRSHLTQVKTVDATGMVLRQFDYTVDAVGHRLSVVSEDGFQSIYEYDKAGRLIRESIEDAGVVISENTFELDAVGNIIAKVICDALENECIQLTRVYDANDRLVSETRESGEISTEMTFAYNNNGQLLSMTGPDTSKSYSWDARGRLVGVETQDHDLAFIYDPEGARISRTVDGDTVSMLVDKNRKLSEVLEVHNASGALTESYTYGEWLESVESDSGQLSYLYDGLGSARGMIDSTGTLTREHDFGVYGQTPSTTGVMTGERAFAGEAYEAQADLYFLRARYYSPEIERFISMDSCSGCSNDKKPITKNLYIYSNSDPVNYTDPSGHFGIAGSMAAVSIGTTILFPSILEVLQWLVATDGSIDRQMKECGDLVPSLQRHLSRNSQNQCPVEKPIEGESDCRGRTFSKAITDTKYRATDGCECAGYDTGGRIYGTFNFEPDWFNNVRRHRCMDVVPHKYYNEILGYSYEPRYPQMYSCSNN